MAVTHATRVEVRDHTRAHGASAVAGGVVAGLIAGMAMEIVAMVHAWAIGAGFWLPAYMIAALWYGEPALIGGADVIIVGMLTHFATAAAFGLLFGLIVGRDFSTGAALVAGLVYGVAIWAVMTYVTLPLFNSVMYERAPSMMPGMWFILHLVYGAFLAFTPPLARAFENRTATRTVREERRVEPT